jgi:hypothetical protein
MERIRGDTYELYDWSSLALFNFGSNSERVWGGRGFVGRKI